MSRDQHTKVSLEPLEGTQTRRVGLDEIQKIARELKTHQAALLAIAGAAVGEVFTVESVPLEIGRGRECAICLPDENVSRQHARLEKDKRGRLIIVDLGSTNGTFINGKPITRHTLKDGDKIQFGHTNVLKFNYQNSVESGFYVDQYERAVRDGLTGTFNRRHLLAELRRELAYALRRSEAFSLIMFDIDHFKQINDTYGHQAGDAVLQQLAKLVNENLREEDLLGRYGGEEFAIILRGHNMVEAHESAERIRRLVETADFVWEEQRIPVTVSLGIATRKSNELTDAMKLLKAADENLYAAKCRGRNQSVSLLSQQD